MHQLSPPEGRQLNGHSVFSQDSSRLMMSKVVAKVSAGRIGVWHIKTHIRISAWQTYGISPPDMKRWHDGRIIAATGSVQTDPSDRAKLRINAERPSLSLLSLNGNLLGQVDLGPDQPHKPIRHLALLPDGVAFAMKWEGDAA